MSLLQASRLLLNLDRDHALAAAVFPTTLDDGEVRRLPEDEVDELLALNVFQAILDKELVANVPSVLIDLQHQICETEAIVDDAFLEWLSDDGGDGDRMGMFSELVVSIRKQWAESQVLNDARREDDDAIGLIEEGGCLAIYYASGKKKHDRFFSADCERGVLSWRKTGKFAGAAGGKTMQLVAVEETIHLKTAREWFDAVDFDGDGVLDTDQLSALYLRARGTVSARSKPHLPPIYP